MVFAYAAQRTFEIFGYFFPGCAGGDVLFGYSYFGIIFPAAHFAYILCHGFFVLIGL